MAAVGTNPVIDGLGRLTNARETLGINNFVARTYDWEVSYDKRSQLDTVKVTFDYTGNPTDHFYQQEYSWHHDGNLDSYEVGTHESTGDSTDFGYNGDLLSVFDGEAISHDLNGNMLDIAGIGDPNNEMTYTWDNKLQDVSFGNTAVSLRYDPHGNRIAKGVTVNGVSTNHKYIVDTIGSLPVILFEIDTSTGQIVRTYVHANAQPLTMYDGPQDNLSDKYYYLHDRLGSVRLVIDQSAETTANYTYEPFGEMLAGECSDTTLNNPLRFTGQFFDEEIGQYHLRARQYDPATARFTSRDPVYGFDDEPLTLHVYLYCLNEPINSTDLSGRFSLADTMAAMARYANMAANAWDGASTVKTYAQMITSGASINSVLLSVAIDVGMEVAGGKAFDLLSGAGGRIMAGINSAGNNLKLSPEQWHHFATNKSKKWTKKMEGVVEKYGLSLDGDWNKRRVHHQGRHPDDYHKWVLDNMRDAAELAGDDVDLFQQMFEENIINEVLANPDLLRKIGWL